MLLDIGTNAELVLAHEDRFFVSSAAAGPALELSVLGNGRGRIDVSPCGPWPQNGRVVHLRGSTLLDALADLLDSGAVLPNGRISGGGSAASVACEHPAHTIASPHEVESFNLTQDSIRQIQLAVAALRSGTEHVLAAAGVRAQDVSRVVVTGSFGVRLNPRSMVRVGLLPPEWEERVDALQNAAGLGAAETLVDSRLADRAADIAAAALYIPLGGSREYVDRFIRAMGFPSRTGE
jgi:uncharacterized 2Fe-2S/4Fe-4S cluster protein (DUF4445 family)